MTERENSNFEQPEPRAEHAEKPEFSATPEEREAAMEFLQDINQEGTAFTVINVQTGHRIPYESVQKMLHNGILPQSEFFERDVVPQTITEARALRSRSVFFNIVGRGRFDSVRSESGRELSPFEQTYNGGWSGTSLIVDVSGFQEEPPSNRGYKYKHNSMLGTTETAPLKTFWAEGPGLDEQWQQDFGDLKPGDERIRLHPAFERWVTQNKLDRRGRPRPMQVYGFATHYRFRPANFRGFVVPFPEDKQGRLRADPKRFQQETVEGLVQAMRQSGDEKREPRVLPIYDYRGNLFWPEVLSNEDIRTQIETRSQEEGGVG